MPSMIRAGATGAYVHVVKIRGERFARVSGML
jgi:hypothetical protein